MYSNTFQRKTRLHKIVSEIVKKDSLEYTQPEIQSNIGDYGVVVNGKTKFNRLLWVYPTDNIDLPTWPEREHGDFSEIKVLEDTLDYLMVYKPVGVVVESGAGHSHHNLLDHLKANENILQSRKLTLVHRLDKDTQGLLLLAKGERNQQFFQDQFRLRQVEKKYLAVVSGIVDKIWSVENWQARDQGLATRQRLFWQEHKAINYDPKSRKAVSIIKPINYCVELNQSLVEIEIKTGRMHQIRLQCEALGFPLLEDKTYNRQIDDKPLIEGIESDYKVSILEPEEFKKLQKSIFKTNGYSLLSNYLKLKKPTGEVLEKTFYTLK